MSSLTTIATLVDEIGAERCDLIRVGFELERHERYPGGDIGEAVLAALQLQHAQPDDDGRQAPAPFHHPWGPRDTASPEVIAVWEQLVEVIESRAVRARLHDLLWIDQAGDRPFEHARAAVEDYLAAADSRSCEGLYQAFGLLRALDLARQVNARDLLGAIGASADQALAAEVERDDAPQRPGVSGRLLGLLIDLPEPERPRDLSSRLEQMHALLEEKHPHDREGIFQLQQKLARNDPEEVARLQRANVRVWIDWALTQEGGVFRRGALSMALERANSISDADELRDEIRLLMQESVKGDLGLEETAVDLDVPAQDVEELIEFVVSDDGIERALVRFGFWGPPTGDPEQNQDAVRQELEEFVFWSLIPLTLSDHQGRPIRSFVTPEQKREVALLRRETWSAGFHGSLATLVLDRIGERYAPTREELASMFGTAAIASEQADAFARAMEHYWEGRFDEAIHIALPRIEAVLRQILVTSGGISYTEPHGGHAGHDKALGTILSELRTALPDEGWRRSMMIILTEPTGLNLRNRYLHGQIPEAQKLDAALVLQIAANLRLLVLGEPQTQD